MVYSDPIISEVATIYPVNKSVLTIPRIKINGTVTNTDGSTTTYRMPRSHTLIRQNTEVLELLPNASNNLFTLASIEDSTQMRVNKRYFILNSVHVHDGSARGHTIALTVRPDARGQLIKDFTFVDENDNDQVVTGKLVGNIDFDRGIVQFGCTFATRNGGLTYTAISASCSTIFSAITSDIGRVKVKLEIDGWDKVCVPT